MHSRLLSASALLAGAVVALTACATPTIGQAAGSPTTPPLGSLDPSPPTGEVIAEGTVMDVAGEVELCLGAVAESYPPQCSGILLELWSWDNLEGAETSGDVTWGSYAVRGTYDGERFEMAESPTPLALYDPPAWEDPTGGEPGAGTEDELLAIQEQLPDRLGADYLGSGPQDGRLWVTVLWDDGTWQSAADAEFGADKVLIVPMLRPAG